MITNSLLVSLALGIPMVLLQGCNSDDDLPEVPQPVQNEPETITTIDLHFNNEADGSHAHVEWSDPDGPGGDEPTVEDIVLDDSATYTVEVMFIDASGDQAEDITSEVQEEADEHLICYQLDPAELRDNLKIERTDSDGDYEIGLASTWTTNAASTGSLVLSLKHQPGGEKDGTCDVGDTDVEITFNVTIE